MNKIFKISAFFLGLLFTQVAFAGCADGQCSAPEVTSGAPADHQVGEQATGECYCLYVKYEPCYYTTKHCVEEQVPCKRKCCRTVPKYYEVQRCRYVPQYYTETVCKNEKEEYYVDETRCQKKWVCQQECKYVPKYYWKHNCATQDTSSQGCAPAQSGCASSGYGR